MIQNEILVNLTDLRLAPEMIASYQKALLAAKAVIEKKAENVKILDLTGISSIADYFVICSGLSTKQIQAIADSTKHTIEETGCHLLSKDGYAEGRWVLLDFGDVIVHIFLDALRDYYDIERLWASVPQVKVPPEFFGPIGTLH